MAESFFLSPASQRLFLPSVPFEEAVLFSDWKAKEAGSDEQQQDNLGSVAYSVQQLATK